MCLNSKLSAPPLPRLCLSLTYGLSQIPTFLVGDGYLLLGVLLPVTYIHENDQHPLFPSTAHLKPRRALGAAAVTTGLLMRCWWPSESPYSPPHPDSEKPRESPVPSLSPYSTQMITEDSVVYYNYSIIGAATVKLRVVAEWEQATLGAAGKGVAQKTGDFSTSLKLQGGCRGAGLAQVECFLFPPSCWLLVGGTKHRGLCPRVLHGDGTQNPVSPWLW